MATKEKDTNKELEVEEIGCHSLSLVLQESCQYA